MTSKIAFIFIVIFLTILSSFQAANAVEVKQVISPNGIKAWLVKDDSLAVTAIEFSFTDAGIGQEKIGKYGLVNMVASLIDEGAGDIDSQDFQKYLNDHSIRLSYSARLDSFGGSFYSLNRYLDNAINMLSLSLTKPRFDKEPVERIRDQIIQSIKQSDSNPNSIASKKLWQNLFPTHHYGRNVKGNITNINNITADDMRKFTKSELTRDNLVIGVVGDITEEKLGVILDKAFGDLPAGNGKNDSKNNSNNPIAPILLGKNIIIDMDIPQSVIAFAQGGIARDDKSFYAAYILNHILGGGSFTSRLTKEVREKHGLVYSIYSHLYPMNDAAIWIGGAATKNANAGKAISLIKQEWQRLLNDGISQKELEDAKTYLTGAYPLRFTNSSNIASMLVAVQRKKLGIDYFDRRNILINNVTIDAINNMAKHLLKPDNLTIIIVGAPESIS